MIQLKIKLLSENSFLVFVIDKIPNIKNDQELSDYLKNVFEIIKEKAESHQRIEAGSVMALFDDDEIGEVTKIMTIDAMCDDKSKAVSDYVAAIKQEMRKAKIQALLQSGDMQALNEFLKNK